MATQVLSDISSALSQLFQPKLERQFNKLAVLAEALPKKPGQGKNIAWDVRFDRSTHAAAFTEGADMGAAEFQVDPTTPATLSWGQYRVGFSLSGISVAAAATSPGSAMELLDQFESNLDDAAMDLVSQINAHLYTGTGASNQIAGLTGAGAIALSGTYANISRGTFAAWASNVVSNSGTPRALSKSLMDQLEEQIYLDCALPPDVIVCTPAIARKFEGLFDSMQRVFVERGEASVANGSSAGASWIPENTGYTGLHYKGVPVLRDRNCPAGTLFMLNRNQVEIRSLPQVNLGTVSRSQMKPMSGVMGANSTGLSARVESLAKLGDADKFQLVTYLQLAVRRPNSCGLINDIDES